MMTQFQQYEMARRKLADANSAFSDLVNHPTNPLTREDLEANIKRHPELWARYSGFLDTLPPRKESDA